MTSPVLGQTTDNISLLTYLNKYSVATVQLPNHFLHAQKEGALLSLLTIHFHLVFPNYETHGSDVTEQTV